MDSGKKSKLIKGLHNYGLALMLTKEVLLNEITKVCYVNEQIELHLKQVVLYFSFPNLSIILPLKNALSLRK